MISAIVLAGRSERDLASMLAALVPAAVDGLVRQVAVVSGEPSQAVTELCEDAGATIVLDLASAAAGARADLLLVVPEDLRLRPGWDESVRRHLEGQGGRALVCESDPGLIQRLLPPRKAGVLLDKARFERIAPSGMDDLRRGLGGAPRLS